MTHLTDEEFDRLSAYVSDRYASSGLPDDVVKALDHHNDRVLGFAEAIADGEHLDPGDRELLRTIAVLHDAAKADTHLLHHAEAGAELAAELLEELDKPKAFIESVQSGIVCHMGPFPFVDEEAAKYSERTGEELHLPRPQTAIDRLFYDADMLALMDIDGIEKVVVLRSTTTEFIEEDERTAATDGGTPRAAAYRSALQSVLRAAATLHSDTAKRIGQRLAAEAHSYVAARTDDRSD